MSARGRALSVIAVVAAIALRTVAARAHAIGISQGDYRRTPDGLAVEITLAATELAPLVPSLAGGEGGESAGTAAELEAAIVRRIEVRAGDATCAGELTGFARLEEDGIAARARFRCLDPSAPITVRLDLLNDLSHGHRHAAHVVSGPLAFDELCFKDHPTLAIGGASADARGEPWWSPAAGFLRMGVEHILTGYDHLVFLFALVLVGAKLRALGWVVTAFTVAHSLTLALAVLGLFAPPARVVEPAIALSIAYVGVENFFPRAADARWRIAFPFGLVHGFGFAGALSQVGLAPARVPLALVAFNLGVELGQLAALALLLPVVLHLRKRAGFTSRIVPALSAAVVLAGVAWFIERVAT